MKFYQSFVPSDIAFQLALSQWVLLGLCVVGFWIIDFGSNLCYSGYCGGVAPFIVSVRPQLFLIPSPFVVWNLSRDWVSSPKPIF
ncbi:hypothetical protein TSUD_228270 [Trifolium subterraneum]|uniref:Uncharacterized protein n=1 Tax=Trifolium subterraneum TaxID=3900 RepID=A0A2Z6MKX3_TRISU|nr:hypothetical protein TSUD_228270 [Trifolium subterraneum]